ncbi:hypothetical protein NQ318_015166 [Aromia moschata]|uniref:Prohibitin n=1 Tax=Aromia moschata TaxID=1265417 RepID=A0AAV8Y0J8_9CUCU|nr:hypothetical protein NQ318_015166 [Aromia moschata]
MGALLIMPLLSEHLKQIVYREPLENDEEQLKTRIQNAVKSLSIEEIRNTVDAAYKTHGYKVQSLIRLKIARNSPDVSEYIEKNSVIRLITSDIRLSL